MGKLRTRGMLRGSAPTTDFSAVQRKEGCPEYRRHQAGPMVQEWVREQKWRRSSAEAGAALTVNFRPLVKVIIFPNLLFWSQGPAVAFTWLTEPRNARLVPGGSLWERDISYLMKKEFDQLN
ncbi:hypothetical protein AAU01_14230 [Paenarthrobacter aurescens]|uniref:Uncharacterized protein n=1 Tax=Paenarthrobacter aurescens TaxID=43663 RepID=A0A4Y3NHY2_PAEAU|nr:hypothetical protein AAU01_14230 [Paenarthrobacter aurescens]